MKANYSAIVGGGAILAAVLLAGSLSGRACAQQPGAADAAARQFAAAAALQNRDQFELAAEEWTKFLSQFATDARAIQARHHLGVCQLKNGQSAAAAQNLEQVIAGAAKANPKPDLLDSTYLYLGMAQYDMARAGQSEMYAKAEQNFATLVSRFPSSRHVPRALFYQAESLYSQDKKPQAVELYQQFVSKHPSDVMLPEALYALGVAQNSLGRNAEAGAAYDSFLKQFPNNSLATEVRMRRAETLLADRNFSEAEKLYAAVAAQTDFQHADDAAMRQATCLHEQKQYAKAAALYAQVPTRFSNTEHATAACLEAGKCYHLAGEFAAARPQLEKVIDTRGPMVAEAAHWLALGFLKQQQPAEALRVVGGALPQAEGSPFYGQLQMDQADALYDLPDRRAEAVNAYKALAQQHVGKELAPRALYMAGFTALELGDFKAALGLADEFLSRYAANDMALDVKYIAAESQLQLSKFAEAERIYADLLSRYPNQADADLWKVRRGLCLFLEKKYKETIAALGPVAHTLSKKSLAAEAHYLIGSSQNELKEFPAAIRSLEAALAADAAWRQADETLLALAHAQRQTNNLAAAQQQLEQLMGRFRQSAVLDRAYFRLGEYAYASGDFKKAAERYAQVVEGFPQSPLVAHALHAMGWCQLSQNQFDTAETTFTRLINGKPGAEQVAAARYARGLARQQIKHYAPAVDDLQAFLKSNPAPQDAADALYVLGLCQVGAKKPDEAVGTFRKLLADAPNYSSADKVLYELGWALKSQGKDAEAADVFGRLVQEWSGSSLAADSLFQVGQHAYAQGEFDKAAKAYYEAMNKAGKNDLGERATHKLAWAYYRQDAFEKARKTFNYQRSAYPEGPLAGDAGFMEAESLFKLGQYKEALALYQQVEHPSGKDFAVLALLHAGQAAGQIEQWDQSLKLLQTAAKEHADSPYLPQILYDQARALQNLEKADEAIALFETVTSKTDTEVAAQARFMIGEIYFAQEKYSDAIRNFFKVAYGYSYPQWQAAAHLDAGICFERLGKKTQARQSYQEVIDKQPNSALADDARLRLKALQ